MKGSTVQVMLKSLKGKRLEAFFVSIKQEANGKNLVKMCKYLRAADEVSETDMTEEFKLTRGQFYHWVDVIGDLLMAFLEGKDNVVQLQQTYKIAKGLVSAVENEAAIDLIKMGIKGTTQIEDFELQVKFCDLLEPIIPQPKIEGLDPIAARQLRDNLNAYDTLMAALERIAKNPNAAMRRKAVTEIQASELLSSPNKALSKRATYFFWKSRSFCHALLREYMQSTQCQEVLLKHIEKYPWVCNDIEYSIAKETSILVQHLKLILQNERFGQVCEAFEQMKFKSPRAEQERDFFHYPISIAAPIDFGNTDEAIRAIHSFLVVFNERGDTFAPTYVTENLYCCLYGALATQNDELWVTVFRLMLSFSKPDFKPRYYPMFRFLEIVHTLEAKEWDDALRLIKNIKAGNGPDELEGTREVLGFLGRMIIQWQQNEPEKAFHLDAAAQKELAQITEGIDLKDYFDLPAWFKAMAKGCSMMKIIHHHRANPKLSL